MVVGVGGVLQHFVFHLEHLHLLLLVIVKLLVVVLIEVLWHESGDHILGLLL